MSKMKQIDQIYHTITQAEITREICQMMIFRSKSNKAANKVVMDLCLGGRSACVAISEYVLTLGSKDPVFKLVERSMDDLIDMKRGLKK